MKSALRWLVLYLSLCFSWAKRTTRRLSCLANVPQDIAQENKNNNNTKTKETQPKKSQPQIAFRLKG